MDPFPTIALNTGERIKRIRVKRGMTQKELGMALGFPERSADVRIAQYESGTRKPKEDLVNALAKVLKVSPHAIADTDYDTPIGLMYTLFDLEDTYGIHIDQIDGELCLRMDRHHLEGRAAAEKVLGAGSASASRRDGISAGNDPSAALQRLCVRL